MLLDIFIIFGLSLFLQLTLPWWTIVFPAFVIGIWRMRSSRTAFGTGFAGVGALWFITSVFIHFKNNGILAEKIGQMLNLPGSFFVIVITVLIGGLAGGLAAVSGFYLRQIIFKS